MKYGLIRILWNCLPRKNLPLEDKLTRVQDSALKAQVYFNCDTQTNNGLQFSIKSTLAFIHNHSSDFEKSLKELLPAFLVCFGIKSVPEYFMIDNVCRGFEDIAPPGFEGFELDYYYLERILRDANAIRQMLNEEQLKQFNDLIKEISLILNFVNINDQPVSLDRLLKLNGTTINVTYSDLITKTLSSNTFSRVINVLNTGI